MPLDLPSTRVFADSLPASVGHLWAGERGRKVIHELCDAVDERDRELAELRGKIQRIEQQAAMKLKGDCGSVGM